VIEVKSKVKRQYLLTNQSRLLYCFFTLSVSVYGMAERL